MQTVSQASSLGRLVRATGTVMLFFVLSRALGLAREIAIGYQFGTSAPLDAYVAAFRIPDLLFNLVAGGALASAFIPPYTARLAANDVRASWRLASQVINLVFVVMALLCLAAALAAEPLVGATVGVGFTLAQKRLTADLMRIMLLTPTIFAISGIVMAILNAHQEFLLPAIAPVVYNLGIIGGALLLAPTFGVYGLAWGVVAGAWLHLLIQVPWLMRRPLEYAPQLGLRDPGVQEVVRLMLPRTLGIAAVQINFLVNTILASTLPAGGLAALNYAWLLILLPIGVIAQSIATVLFPTFSRLYALNDVGGLRRAFSVGFRVTLFLTIPATVGLYLLRMQVIEILLQRGAFDARSTAQTALALQFFAIGLFAHAGLETLTRAFYALHDTATPVRVGVAAVGLNIALSLVLFKPLAQGGLALANSLATMMEMLALLYWLRPRLGGMDGGTIARSVAKMVLGAVVMGVAIQVWLALSVGQNEWLVILGGMALGAVAYLATMVVLQSPEAGLARQIAASRTRIQV